MKRVREICNDRCIKVIEQMGVAELDDIKKLKPHENLIKVLTDWNERVEEEAETEREELTADTAVDKSRKTGKIKQKKI